MLRVRDIMTRDVTVVAPETTLRDAMELFAREHVSGAPVVSGRELVGVISTSDLLGFAATVRPLPSPPPETDASADWEDEPREPELEFQEDLEGSSAFFSEMWYDSGADVSERMASADAPEWNRLEEHDVREVMTPEVWSLPSGADAREAADMMRDHSIHRVLIVDDGMLVGIVSALDIAKAVSERKFFTRTYVFPS
ncbi:MAG TPA: CBS domain-containing protein [Gemmatimonadaceae bacterium]|nr:CBS domain-containing protein [Gemmatimonadaceae bacterium]